MPSSLDLIPLASGEPRFLNTWINVCREGHRREQQYLVALRQRGCKAAHPDDGWVGREKNELQFVYPHFNDGVKVGDLVALGYEFDRTTRIVRLTERRKGRIFDDLVKWAFEEVEKVPNSKLLEN